MKKELVKSRAVSDMRTSSDRQFGLVMALFFLILTFISAWKHGWNPHRLWPALSMGFGFFALVAPRTLAPVHWVWGLFGQSLHKVMNPLVMGVLYFVFFTPFGFFFRFVKRDPLGLKIDKQAVSYWIERNEQDQPGGGMAKQF